jgi:hypothetical protein
LPDDVAAAQGLVSSTPSICALGPDLGPGQGSALAICVRYVNYRVDDAGNYINQDHIVTKNVVSIVDTSVPDAWRKVDEFVLQYDTSLDGRYVGPEDVRLWCAPGNGQLYYNANRALEGGGMQIEHGRIRIDGRTTCDDVRLQYEHARELEKNWVLFSVPNTESIHCVYSWSPLVIGRIDAGGVFNEIHRSEDVPRFFSFVRGSSNGVAMTGPDGCHETWFLCHVVSYEDRRYYYHLLVVLDSHTMRVKRYTSLFTFQGDHPKVEYSLGFVPISPAVLLFGYSVNDRETKYMTVSRDALEQRMISYPAVRL